MSEEKLAETINRLRLQGSDDALDGLPGSVIDIFEKASFWRCYGVGNELPFKNSEKYWAMIPMTFGKY